MNAQCKDIQHKNAQETAFADSKSGPDFLSKIGSNFKRIERLNVRRSLAADGSSELRLL